MEYSSIQYKIPEPVQIEISEVYEQGESNGYLKEICEFVSARAASVYSVDNIRDDLFPDTVIGKPVKTIFNKSEWSSLLDMSKKYVFVEKENVFISVSRDNVAQLVKFLVFEFDKISRMDEQKCISVTIKYFSLLRSIERQERIRCISSIYQLQSNHPKNSITYHSACRAIKSYFNSGIASLSLIEYTSNDEFMFHRFYIDNNNEEGAERFLATKGFSHICATSRDAMIVASVNLDKRKGHCIFYQDIEGINKKSNHEEIDVDFIITPKSLINEKSLMFIPLFDLSFKKVIGIAKVGSYEKLYAFNELHLISFVEIGKSLSLLINALQLTQAANSIGYKIDNAHELEEFLVNFLAYKEMSLGLFHQVSNKIHEIYCELDTFSLDYHAEKTIPLIDYTTMVDKTNSAISVAKKHIKKAQKLGNKTGFDSRECELVNDLLNNIYDYAVELSRSSNKKNKISIKKVFGKIDYIISVDPDYIYEAFVNIIDNSAWAVRKNKYSAENLIQIFIQHNLKKQEVEIFFEDNGVGIQREDISKIFKPNFTTKRNGTGYGAFFAEKIILESNGMISVVKSLLNKGTKISVSFPYLKTIKRYN